MKQIKEFINENKEIDDVKDSLKGILTTLINKFHYAQDVKEAFHYAIEYNLKYYGNNEDGEWPEKIEILKNIEKTLK